MPIRRPTWPCANTMVHTQWRTKERRLDEEGADSTGAEDVTIPSPPPRMPKKSDSYVWKLPHMPQL